MQIKRENFVCGYNTTLNQCFLLNFRYKSVACWRGGGTRPQLAILGGRKNAKRALIPRRILKVGGKNAFEKM